MPRYDSAHSHSGRIDIELRKIVNRVEVHLANLQQFRIMQALRPSSFVIVAAHGGNGGQRRKLFENAWCPNVATVNDAVASVQKCFGLGPKQAVSVGNQSHASHRANFTSKSPLAVARSAFLCPLPPSRSRSGQTGHPATPCSSGSSSAFSGARHLAL